MTQRYLEGIKLTDQQDRQQVYQGSADPVRELRPILGRQNLVRRPL
jgi:hypothetical protein